MLNCTATYLCSCDGRASNEHRPHRGMRVAASLVEQKIPYSMCHFHLVPNTSLVSHLQRRVICTKCQET